MLSVTDFYGPELIRTSGPIITAVEEMDSVPEELGTLWILHAITPESDHATHYFGMMVRNFRLDDDALDETMRLTTSEVRRQDVVAIEAVEARIEMAHLRQRELLAKSDGPAVKVRQMIQKMLDAEIAV